MTRSYDIFKSATQIVKGERRALAKAITFCEVDSRHLSELQMMHDFCYVNRTNGFDIDAYRAQVFPETSLMARVRLPHA